MTGRTGTAATRLYVAATVTGIVLTAITLGLSIWRINVAAERERQRERLESQARWNREQGKLEESLTFWQELQAVDPGRPGLQAGLGAVLLDMGRVPEARRALEAALDAGAVDGDLLEMAAAARALLGDGPGAEALLDEALRREPERWSVLYRLAALRLQRGDEGGAVGLFREAIRLVPEVRQHDFQNEVADLVVRSGKPDLLGPLGLAAPPRPDAAAPPAMP